MAAWGQELVRKAGLPAPLLLLLAAYAAFTLYLASSLNLWIDEVYSLSTTSLSIVETIPRALTFENQPPLYFLVLRLWRLLGDSVFVARVLSVLLLLACMWLLGRFASRFGDPASVFCLMFFAVSNPLVIWAAVEIRVYAMALLLITLVLTSFDALLFRPSEGSGRFSLVHSAYLTLGLYAYPFVGFLVPGNLLFVLAERGQRLRWRRLAISMAAGCVLALPVVYWSMEISKGVGETLPNVDPTLSLGGGARLVLERLEENLVPVYELLRLESRMPEGGVSAVYWLTRLLILGLGLFAVGDMGAWRSLLRDSRARWLVGVLLCVVLAQVTMLAFVKPVASSLRVGMERHTAFLLVLAFMLLAVVAAHAGRARWFQGLLITLGVLNCLVLAAEYRIPAKHGDSKRVADFLEANARAEEPILVFPSEEILALRVYFQGANRIEAIPEEPSLERYVPDSLRLTDESQVQKVLDRLGDNTQSLWLVYNRDYKMWGHVLDMGSEYLESYLETEYSTDLEQEFRHGVVVMRLVRALDEP